MSPKEDEPEMKIIREKIERQREQAEQQEQRQIERRDDRHPGEPPPRDKD
jgi:hypothetical protein